MADAHHRFVLRVPEPLWGAVARAAEVAGLSANAFILARLTESVARQQPAPRSAPVAQPTSKPIAQCPLRPVGMPCTPSPAGHCSRCSARC